ncbi:hypothetical protein [Microcystis sp. LE19-195.1E]|jgi:predicted cobalt transporter CbtA|uniref:hypothetical protein n=1 Tax=Microcystis sp. LE19-195.1E TaxID=3016440 RepID=UPI0022C9877E|nr:hypothetical protein [Microcystis sp. LE19-195.1E]MCZ8249504.1 hypothetical protein [Microcystis sp. LE19-195.1E]
MANFYYGSAQGQAGWINLDQVLVVIIELDKLILKMMDKNAIAIDEEYEEYKDNDKRHNHEDVPTQEEVEASIFEPEDWEPKDCDLDDDEIPF